MPRIVITDYEFESIDQEQTVAEANGIKLELAYCRTEDDVLRAASDADGLIVQYAPITQRVLKKLPRLKAIGRYGVGVDNIDVQAATECGIAVSNVPDYGVEDVSDHAITLALTLARGIPDLDRGVRSGRNLLNSVKPLRRFSTQTFGVVGLGLIGAATAAKAKALGFRALGFDPLHTPGTTTKEGVLAVSLDDLLAESDVVSLHVPLNKHTHHLINARTLEQFKEGATLINTCRGGVVDTEALIDALKIGRIRAAGLDVFEEPLPLNSALLDLDRVVLTPHSAWYTEESNDELKRRTAENVVEACLGRRPRNILSPPQDCRKETCIRMPGLHLVLIGQGHDRFRRRFSMQRRALSLYGIRVPRMTARSGRIFHRLVTPRTKAGNGFGQVAIGLCPRSRKRGRVRYTPRSSTFLRGRLA